MDLPSSSKLLRMLVVIAGLAWVAGCGRAFVRASEKEFLADKVMVYDNDPLQLESDSHVIEEREGAIGGHGAGGGGCGCN